MRGVPFLIAGLALAGCTAQAQEPPSGQGGQAKLEKLLAGKTAGAPISCLPPKLSSRDMVVIDSRTVAFRDGRGRTYVNHLRGQCDNLGYGSYTLVTKSRGSGSCSGDVAEITDVRTGASVGSCALGEFVPYTAPGR
jgi:hypothetical protein